MKETILGSRYKVLEYIAKGGFGTTYLAEDTQLPGKDLCVVKQLSPSSQADNFLKIARRLFESEASALHDLGHHDRIPELLAYFEEEEKFYLVQQYIEGETLEKELNPNQVWSEAQVIELLQDCLEILGFIHTQGVIHRDIKPANLIRRSQDQKIVLVDFGTVKNILQEQTRVGQLTVAVGTQGYMPVEQARGKPRPTSDIYALGIIGIEALTRVEPLELEEDEDGELIWFHLAKVDRRLAEILTKMTRCDHRNRYQTAQEAGQALAALTNLSVTIPQAIANNQPVAHNNLGTARLTTFPVSAISDEPSVAEDIPLGTDLQPSSQYQISLDSENRSVAAMIKPAPKVPIKSNKSKVKVIWGIAIALGAAIFGGSYLIIEPSTVEPQSDTPVKPDSPTPRARQGKGFRDNL